MFIITIILSYLSSIFQSTVTFLSLTFTQQCLFYHYHHTILLLYRVSLYDKGRKSLQSSIERQTHSHQQHHDHDDHHHRNSYRSDKFHDHHDDDNNNNDNISNEKDYQIINLIDKV